MADALIERAERWAIRGTRVGVEPGHVPSPERLATGLVGLGLLMLSRTDSRWRVPAAMAAGAALTRAATGVCPMHAALDLPATSTKASLSGPRGQHVREHITIAQPVDTVFAFWRQLSSIGAATHGKITVEVIDGTRSRWQLRLKPDSAPLVEWTAELINEVPEGVLGWRTTSDADVVSAGSVNFRQAPGNQGTEVRVHLQYAPPFGRVGTAAATLSRHSPSVLVREALRDIKRYLEIGHSVVLTA
jgi:uncharacterized membrane protein